MSHLGMRRSQQCCARTAKGDRCDRYCAEGETVCAKHRPNAKPTGVIAAQDTDDVRVLLKRLTKDRDATIRLRAIEAILKWEERRQTSCTACAERASSEQRTDELLAHASPEQRQALLEVFKALNDIKADIRAYIDAGGTPFKETGHAVEQRDQPSGTTAEVSTTPERATAPTKTVMVWRNGTLVEEPRNARKWQRVLPADDSRQEDEP